MYSVERVTLDNQATDRFDTADEAMKSVNRLRALRIANYVIRDGDGAVLTDRQLAMIVMHRRLQTSRRTEDKA